jgi:disulfide bond formation protein DsbB
VDGNPDYISSGMSTGGAEQAGRQGWTLLFLCWLIASVASLGSLFFSDVMGLAPCVLCWYQRIALFPLVLVFGAGLLSFDAGVVKYSLPLAVAGWLVALYHSLLYFGLLPKDIQPCTAGVSCTDRSLELFGFLSIPLMSLLASSAIITLLLVLRRRVSR